MNNNTEMDELDKNLPDDFWRKTFEEAAETPPPRVWAGIERQLDESNGPKVVPMWGTGLASSRPFMWATGLAAAVALLLVGWWVVNSKTVSTSAPSVAGVHPADRQVDKVAVLPGHSALNASSPKAAKPFGDAVASRTQSSAKPVYTPNQQTHLPFRIKQNSETIAQTTPSSVFGADPIGSQQSLPASVLSHRTLAPEVPGISTGHMAIASFTSSERTGFGRHTPHSAALAAFDRLSGKPLRLRTIGAIQRIVWAKPAEMALEPELSKSKQTSREMWASVSMMPGAFNPAVSVRSAQSAFSNSSLASSASSSQSSVSSRANFSVAYQAGAGIQLTDHWSVESGIGYLSGRSSVDTPGQQFLASGSSLQMDVVANRNTGVNNLYADALRSSLRGGDMASSAPQANYANLTVSPYKSASAYDSRNLQTITNDYQYVQVPVQVGYQFRPRKKLSMAVLGGLLTNIFVRNTVGDALVVTGKDGVYRPVSLAATMGARLRYRPSRQWSASVAGVYQPALESSTRSDSQVQNHPTSAGMSFGVDYHF